MKTTLELLKEHLVFFGRGPHIVRATISTGGPFFPRGTTGYIRRSPILDTSLTFISDDEQAPSLTVNEKTVHHFYIPTLGVYKS